MQLDIHNANGYRLGMATQAMEVLNALTKNPRCYVCGQENSVGLGIRFGHTAPFTAEARTIARPEHEGWNGILHGGITFTLMDEAFGWCLYFEGIRAVTAKVEARFLRSVCTGTPLHVRAWVVQDRGRVIYANAEVTSGDGEVLFAEARATMMRAVSGAENKQMTNLTMRPMQSQADADAFRALNEAWITKLFRLEEKDRIALNDPYTTILATGGQVYVAEIGGRIVGTAAWVRYGDGVYELSKMAVDEAVRGQGIGRDLLLYMIEQARAMGARTLFLGSSKKLQNAVHLYEAVGFRYVPPAELPEMKYDRADVFMKMELTPPSGV